MKSAFPLFVYFCFAFFSLTSASIFENSSSIVLNTHHVLVGNTSLENLIESVVDNLLAKKLPRSCLEVQQFFPNATTGPHLIYNSELGWQNVHCDMETNGGGWTLVGKAPAAYPPQDFLWNAVGTWQDDVYSLPARFFPFTETMFGFSEGGFPFYGGFKVPEVASRDLFFAYGDVLQETHTCEKTDGFVYYAVNDTLYSFTLGLYPDLCLTTVVGSYMGGFDLASSDCVYSFESLAFYRQDDTHHCRVGFCEDPDPSTFSGMRTGAFYQDGGAENYYGPRAMSEAEALFEDLATATVGGLWVRVR